MIRLLLPHVFYSLWCEDEVTLCSLVDLLLLHQLRHCIVDDLCGGCGHVWEAHAELVPHMLNSCRLTLGCEVHDDVTQRLGQRRELSLNRWRHNAIVNVACKR